VSTVAIPAEINATATYPMAVVTSTMNEPLAQAFLAYVAGPDGQAVLRDAGFAAP
jgi:molybdate transport system substrate-binding protein